jgi:hypothetical protein
MVLSVGLFISTAEVYLGHVEGRGGFFSTKYPAAAREGYDRMLNSPYNW